MFKPHKHIALHQIHQIIFFLATSYDPFKTLVFKAYVYINSKCRNMENEHSQLNGYSNYVLCIVLYECRVNTEWVLRQNFMISHPLNLIHFCVSWWFIKLFHLNLQSQLASQNLLKQFH